MSGEATRFSNWSVARRDLFGSIQDADLLRLYGQETGLTVSKPCARIRRKKWEIPQYRESIFFLNQWALDGNEIDIELIQAVKNVPTALIKAFLHRDLVQDELELAYPLLAEQGVSPLVVYSLHMILNGSRRPSIRWEEFSASGDTEAASARCASVQDEHSVEVSISTSQEAKRKRGRPKGSRNKSQPPAPAGVSQHPEEEAEPLSQPRRRPGRPKGSKNKARSIVDHQVFQISVLVDGQREMMMIGATDFADVVVKTTQLKAAGQLRGELQGIELIGSLLL